MNKSLSIIIPAYNEEKSLQELYQRIISEIAISGISEYEILFINDGSTDDSLTVMKKIKDSNPRVIITNFFRNYGKAAALSTSFARCSGDYVITMDADLQDDPKEISRLILLMEEKNFDLISGWKKERHDPLEKRLPSKLFNYITSKAGGVRLHDFNCGFKLYRKQVVKSLQNSLYGDMHRFIPLLAHWQGFKVGEMVVTHHARPYGISKYGLARYFHGMLDLLTLTLLNRFKTRPMHIFGIFGILSLLGGLFINGYFLIDWIITQEMHIRPMLLLGVVLIIIAIQFFSLGFISEMITQKNARDSEYIHEEF